MLASNLSIPSRSEMVEISRAPRLLSDHKFPDCHYPDSVFPTYKFPDHSINLQFSRLISDLSPTFCCCMQRFLPIEFFCLCSRSRRTSRAAAASQSNKGAACAACAACSACAACAACSACAACAACAACGVRERKKERAALNRSKEKEGGRERERERAALDRYKMLCCQRVHS